MGVNQQMFNTRADISPLQARCPPAAAGQWTAHSASAAHSVPPEQTSHSVMDVTVSEQSLCEGFTQHLDSKATALSCVCCRTCEQLQHQMKPKSGNGL